MNTTRVVVVDHTAELGGGELALLRLLASLRGGAFEPRVVLFADGPLVARLDALGIPCRIVPLGQLNSMGRGQTGSWSGVAHGARGAVGFLPRLASALREESPALLVANSLKAAAMLSGVAPLIRRPWVWHLHDRLADDYLPARTAGALRIMARRLPRTVVANSRATLETLGPLPAGRAVVAYPGVDDSAFDAPRTDVGRGAPALFGILGRIGETKGQLEFIQAAAATLAERPAARFRIVGAALFQDGGYERRVREEIAARELGAAVELTGWSASPAQAIRNFDVLVHASPTPEPFGQVVVEAMAAGVPVIASDAGGIPEILDPDSGAEAIADGVRRAPLGLLVRPGDHLALTRAMRWAMDNPQELAAGATAARLSASRRFTIEQTREVVRVAWSRAAHLLVGADPVLVPNQ